MACLFTGNFFAADVIGLLIGYLLKSKAPEGILNIVAFVIFFHLWNPDAETGIWPLARGGALL